MVIKDVLNLETGTVPWLKISLASVAPRISSLFSKSYSFLFPVKYLLWFLCFCGRIYYEGSSAGCEFRLSF